MLFLLIKPTILKKYFTIFAIALTVPISSSSQSIDSLKLTDAEIPSYYSVSKDLLCTEDIICNTYTKPKRYYNMFDNVIKKDIQSFKKEGDKGTILYYEFDEPFTRMGLLEIFLWGKDTRPTKRNSSDYFVKDNILIIWSFKLNSEIREISRQKVLKAFDKN